MRHVYVGVCAAIACAAGAQASLIEANLADGLMTSAVGLTRFSPVDPNTTAITPGDSYGAALIGQSTTGAAFITNTGRQTTFAYGSTATHGTLVGSGATVRIGSAQMLIAPNTLRVVVACFTTDNSNLWINGLAIAAQPMIQGRFDVGSGAFTNGLLWDNLPGAITSVSIFSALWSPANNFASPLATSTALPNGRTLPEMGSLVVWNGVVNSGVSEIDMIFDITFIPTPGTASLAAVGALFAARRRR